MVSSITFDIGLSYKQGWLNAKLIAVMHILVFPSAYKMHIHPAGNKRCPPVDSCHESGLKSKSHLKTF